MSKRLEILKQSLIKKEKSYDDKIQNHFDTVKESNGQPLNDKRNGRATLNKWERQNDSIRALGESIEKTKNAIEKEEYKITDTEAVKKILPNIFIEMLENNTLTQWRKYPNTFFVDGVSKARICWDDKKKQVSHKYLKSITDREEYKLFANTYNDIYNNIKQS